MQYVLYLYIDKALNSVVYSQRYQRCTNRIKDDHIIVLTLSDQLDQLASILVSTGKKIIARNLKIGPWSKQIHTTRALKPPTCVAWAKRNKNVIHTCICFSSLNNP